jgi:hypothetical protein
MERNYTQADFLELLNRLCDHAIGCNDREGCEQCLRFIEGNGQDDAIPCDLGRQVFQQLAFARAFADLGTTYLPQPSPFYRNQFQGRVVR